MPTKNVYKDSILDIKSESLLVGTQAPQATLNFQRFNECKRRSKEFIKMMHSEDNIDQYLHPWLQI